MRKGSTLFGSFLAAALFFLGIAQADQTKEQKYCPLCSMNLKMYWKTNHWLTFSDGKKTGYCSIHCAAIIYKERASEIDHWEVVDYDSGVLFDTRAAYFLIGSDLPGTMTPVSKLAFSQRHVAEKYQKEHGGIIGSFDEALRRALDGLGEEMTLIEKNVANMSAMGKTLAGKHGCYQCHGENGVGGQAIGWTSPEFAKAMNNRVKIKEAILAGSHKMQGYEGKIPEKDLHAITLYLWTYRAK